MKVCGAGKSCGFILKQEFRLYEHRKSLQRRHVTQKHSTLSILLNKIQEKWERLLKLNTRLESTQPDLLVGEVRGVLCYTRCYRQMTHPPSAVSERELNHMEGKTK